MKLKKLLNPIISLKIRNKLIISFTILIILPISIIFYTTYINLANIVKSKITNYSVIMLDIDSFLKELDTNLNKSTDFRYLIYNRDDILQLISSDKTISNQNIIDETNFFLKDLIKNQDLISSVEIIKNNNQTFYYTKNKDIKPIDLKNKSYDLFFKMISLKNGNLAWFNKDSQTNTYMVGMQILSKKKLDPIGYLILNIDLNKFKTHYKNNSLLENSNFYIIDSNNSFIYSTSDLNKSNINFNYLLINNNIDNEVINGRLVMYHKSKINNWKYIYEIPEKNILKEFLSLRDLMLLIFLVAIITVIFFAILISTNFTKPIYTLINDMKLAEKGNFSVRIPIETKDEFGLLCKNYNTMLSKIESLVNEVYKEEALRKVAEINALEAQINPHFLYNTLDSINALAELNRPKEISKITIAFAELLRLSITNKKTFVTLKDELTYVSNYIRILNVRYNNKLNLSLNIDNNCNQILIPKLILQPIVENSIVHGFEDMFDNCKIIVKSYIRNKILYIKIYDNGKGLTFKSKSSNLNSKQSIGIENTNKRIQYLYKKEFGVEIKSSLAKGTIVTIKIPSDRSLII